MLKFLGRVLAGLATLFIVFIFFIIIIVAMSGDVVKTPDENAVLHLKMDFPVQEQAKNIDLSSLSFNSDHLSVQDILHIIKEAKKSKEVKGIYIEINSFGGGFAMAAEIRDALADFKQNGKFIIAYGESFTKGAYYVASVADKIYLTPTGSLEFSGFSTELLFFKKTLEKLEITPQIFRVGDYKSAVEPFIAEKMSDANREQVTSFQGSIFNTYLANISASRNIPADTLRKFTDNFTIRNGNAALANKLITDLGYKDQALEGIKKALKSQADIKFISGTDYLKYLGTLKEYQKEDKEIAIIVASGEIRSGKSKDNEIVGSDDICKYLKTVREDKNIAAVVLRINSPGGSALASDQMWREIELTKKVKPVIASMSDVAASGGYYMAMPCNKIVASPTTITGSIGVFGLFVNMGKFLDHKLGITTDRVKTSQYADMGSLTREPSEAEKAIIQEEVNETYADFTSKAAAGRKMHVDSLRKIAGGRVWTGAQAKEIGLVDELGGLEKALELAAASAKLKKYNTKVFPESKSIIEELSSQMGSDEDVQSKIMKQELGELYPYFVTLQKMKDWQGIQARLPFYFRFN